MNKSIALGLLAAVFGAQAIAAPGALQVRERTRDIVKDREVGRTGRSGKDAVRANERNTNTGLTVGSTARDAKGIDASAALQKMGTTGEAVRTSAVGAAKDALAVEKTPALDAQEKASVKRDITTVRRELGNEVADHLTSLEGSVKADGLLLMKGLTEVPASVAPREQIKEMVNEIVAYQKATGVWPIHTQAFVAACSKELDAGSYATLLNIFRGARSGEDILANMGENNGMFGTGRISAERKLIALDGIMTNDKLEKTGATKCKIMPAGKILQTAKGVNPAIAKLVGIL